jgi:plastocyanin
MSKFGLFCAAICLIMAAATACGGSDTISEQSGTATATASPAETSGPAAAARSTITIASMKFGDTVTVSPGAQVTIKNDDTVEHSVTSDDKGKFDVHVDGGEQGSLTAPTEPGEYTFYCVYHPSMKSTLIVK